MPEHIAELTEKERKRLERLGIMLGYKDSETASSLPIMCSRTSWQGA